MGDESTRCPRMKVKDVVAEITSALYAFLSTSCEGDPVAKARYFAKFGVTHGGNFEKAFDEKLRSCILREKRREKRAAAAAERGEEGEGEEGVKKEEEEGEEWGDSEDSEDFFETEVEEDFDETEFPEESDSEDAEVEAAWPLILNRLPPPTQGWSPPPPYLGPPMGRPPSPAPFHHHQPSPPKMPRLEMNQNPKSTTADDWSENETDGRRTPEPPNDHQHTNGLYPGLHRPASTVPWSTPPTGRRILGEIVLSEEPKDEFEISDEDEGQQQQPQVVYRHNHPPSTATVTPPYYPPGTPSPSSDSPPPYWTPPNDENHSPRSTVGSTVGDTPPPPSSVFTPFSIGTPLPPSFTQIADAIFRDSPPTVSPSVSIECDSDEFNSDSE